MAASVKLCGNYSVIMVVELCATCGEEHEAPRGAKCKRTRLPSLMVKQELCVDLDDLDMGKDSAEELVPVRKSSRKKHGVKVEPVQLEVQDEEEQSLRRKLEERACARRKRALRAALEESDTEEADGAVVPGRGTRNRTDGRKGAVTARRTNHHDKEESTSSDSVTSLSTTESSSSDEDDSERRRKRRRAKRIKRRKRSKFDIKKFTKNDKNVKKLTFLELMYASLVWGMRRAEKVGMTVKEVQGYMGHLSYMTMHAITGAYTDSAYREYDKAVRLKVREHGMKYFRQGDQELSLLFFNLDNARSMRDTRRPFKQTTGNTRYAEGYGKARGVCYAFNYDRSGCGVKKCLYDHVCISCRSVDHPISSCPKKRH